VANFQDNLDKLVSGCQTLLDFTAARMMEVAVVTTRTLNTVKIISSSSSVY